MTSAPLYNHNADTIKKKYAVEFASERAEGKAEGKEETTREFARKMIIDGIPLQKVSKMTQLSVEIIQKLAAEVGANFDADV
jgi:predicted transposase/invertase (TIGR01784 family)